MKLSSHVFKTTFLVTAVATAVCFIALSALFFTAAPKAHAQDGPSSGDSLPVPPIPPAGGAPSVVGGDNGGGGGPVNGPAGGGVNVLPVSTGGGFQLMNPLSVGSFCGLLRQILRALLVFGVPIAVLVVIYAGFRFVFARGNMAELAKAKKNLYYVVIGIMLFLGAWMLGEIVANTLNQLGAGTANGTIGSCM